MLEVTVTPSGSMLYRVYKRDVHGVVVPVIMRVGQRFNARDYYGPTFASVDEATTFIKENGKADAEYIVAPAWHYGG